METRIKAMREGRDLKQHEVAAAIGITQRKYSYLETGTQQWPDELLVRLARHQPPSPHGALAGQAPTSFSITKNDITQLSTERINFGKNAIF